MHGVLPQLAAMVMHCDGCTTIGATIELTRRSESAKAEVCTKRWLHYDRGYDRADAQK